MAASRAVDRFERGRDDVDAKHHPRAPSVGIVVHLTRGQWGRVAVVEDPELELVTEHGRDRTALLEPGECARDQGKDIEAHGGYRSRQFVNPGLRRTRRRAGAASRTQSPPNGRSK